MDEVTMFLKQIGNDSPKEKRDKAMIELLYATGIRVSELVCLTKDSLNLKLSYIMVDQKRAVPFGQAAREALVDYLDNGRPFLIKEKETEMLFTNCSGDTISRQGFWKLIKYYGNKAGIQKDITPQTLRNSFAAHLMVAKLVDR